MPGLRGETQRGSDRARLVLTAEVGAPAHLLQVPVGTGERCRPPGAPQRGFGRDLVAATAHDAVTVDPVHGLAYGVHGIGHSGQSTERGERV
ncbi:hypothetical protein Smic_35260 [Streptomyces microflavus]|uniref:Uncharacterized protein n=1 Tax=Streptomyces microflavus TaxID=1919 RepID=A0A7J0CR39_STRMI|nr:hypothetical protein Smic_35260 [Streptomyces microflavus]